MQLPDAAIGSIIAAAIAGLVVFISTVLAKEQKTSEFRQAWIDELRKDISQYISGASEMVTLYIAKESDKAAQEKFLDDNFKLVHELQTIEHRIVLRLNSKEHAILIAQVTGFRQSMLNAYLEAHQSEETDANQNRQAKENRLTTELLDSTKQVLKSEWRRVKKGEPAFRLVKGVALVVIGILAAISTVAIIPMFQVSKKEQTSTHETGDGLKEKSEKNYGMPLLTLPAAVNSIID